jgi:hypothetical protein
MRTRQWAGCIAVWTVVSLPFSPSLVAAVAAVVLEPRCLGDCLAFKILVSLAFYFVAFQASGPEAPGALAWVAVLATALVMGTALTVASALFVRWADSQPSPSG